MAGSAAALDGETTLVREAISGSRAAFARLVERFSGRLACFLAARGLAHEDVEEVVQDAFVRAYEKLSTYDPGRSSFSTWLFTIARNLSTTRARRRSRERAEGDLTDVQAPPGDAGDEAGSGAWAVARRVLPDRQHEVLWLRYGEDMTAREIGSVMGMSEANVRVALHRARSVLAGALQGDMRETGTCTATKRTS
ncbi:MAG: RNA polymerase sigma factor [Planctomycetota bacterium]